MFLGVSGEDSTAGVHPSVLSVLAALLPTMPRPYWVAFTATAMASGAQGAEEASYGGREGRWDRDSWTSLHEHPNPKAGSSQGHSSGELRRPLTWPGLAHGATHTCWQNPKPREAPRSQLDSPMGPTEHLLPGPPPHRASRSLGSSGGYMDFTTSSTLRGDRRLRSCFPSLLCFSVSFPFPPARSSGPSLRWCPPQRCQARGMVYSAC